MELPIYIDGKTVGRITLTPEEGGVRLTARMTDPGRVVRLTLYGAGALYLGIPLPAEGGLVLEKRVDPGELPTDPAYAAEEPLAPEKPHKKRVLWHGGRPYYF